jgi:hypothetical protein
MSIWDWIARHGSGVQRREEWAQLLGELLPSWTPFLSPVRDPVGIRFWSRLGGSEEEYEVHADTEGIWAVPVEGGAPVRMNPTQAEFLRLDLGQVLECLRASVALRDAPSAFEKKAGAYALGFKDVEGHSIAVFAVPRARDLEDPLKVRNFFTANQRVGLAVALVPTPTDIPPAARGLLREGRLLLGELPHQSPWSVDLTEIAAAPDLGFELRDLGAFCGRRFVLIVDRRQQKVWIEGKEVDLKADSQPYLLIAHLAERPGVSVTNRDLANQVLSSKANSSMEGKIVDGAKGELKKKVGKALEHLSAPRVTADGIVVSDNGRQRLDLPPNLVLVR